MNELNAHLEQQLVTNNLPPAITPVPNANRSHHSHRSGDCDSQNHQSASDGRSMRSHCRQSPSPQSPSPQALNCPSLDPSARPRILMGGEGHLADRCYQHWGECSGYRVRFDKEDRTSIHGVGNGGQSLVQVQVSISAGSVRRLDDPMDHLILIKT
ncbi:hypothetical protein Acr_07g0012350 [Actinidia rufa]|uniref:Uncharacterized protein n=1 Tax=Actinidia rufa TaxID=165716 RepID=A0A7J0EYI3_9ERIC|nr:hypothetical protein Acr_07g0012350 [Actinidia rufa]